MEKEERSVRKRVSAQTANGEGRKVGEEASQCPNTLLILSFLMNKLFYGNSKSMKLFQCYGIF